MMNKEDKFTLCLMFVSHQHTSNLTGVSPVDGGQLVSETVDSVKKSGWYLVQALSKQKWFSPNL